MTARIGRLGFILFPWRISRLRGRPGNPVSHFGSAPPAAIISPRCRREASSSVVLLRHGQSTWNKIPTFSGWCDVPLTPQGITEAQGAGKLLFDRGYTFDVAFTSELQRAGKTCQMALQVLDPSVPVVENWQLNERHYGALQGRSKNCPQLRAQYGLEQLKAWRREFHAAPPPMETSHPYYQIPPAPSTGTYVRCC
jgi:bisphosphoglycerate-dependent phosphoglycerate mutase family 1